MVDNDITFMQLQCQACGVILYPWVNELALSVRGYIYRTGVGLDERVVPIKKEQTDLFTTLKWKCPKCGTENLRVILKADIEKLKERGWTFGW